MAFKKGDQVFWEDPDNNFGSGVYTVDDVWNAGEPGESYLIYNDNSDAEVFADELIDLGDLRTIIPGYCRSCSEKGEREAADYLVGERFYCAAHADRLPDWESAPERKKILRSRTGSGFCFVKI